VSSLGLVPGESKIPHLVGLLFHMIQFLLVLAYEAVRWEDLEAERRRLQNQSIVEEQASALASPSHDQPSIPSIAF